MASSSKSSQKAKNVILALLTLWSIISLIIIVVWATSPDLKSSAQCRAELQKVNTKLEGDQEVWKRNKVALEEKVLTEREEKDRLRDENLLLLGRLTTTNASLQERRQEIVVLNGNISVLQGNVELLRETEANLTAQISLQEDHIAALEQNLTQAAFQTTSCFSLKSAAESQMSAAQSQTAACESGQQYLQTQLQKCKETASDGSQQTQNQKPPSSTPGPCSSANSPLSGIPVLVLLVFSALHLTT